MKFKERLLQGYLIKRYKRFFVDIKYENKIITAHCPNSGSMMGLLEKGVSWISLFIALAPMLGFMGTVIGMIQAFDSIAEAGGIEASAMAGSIKMALITTVAGLVVAMILQVFYNIIIAKIDNIVNQMENASNSFIKIVQNNIG